MIRRRTVLIGVCGLIATPALVRAASIMPVRPIRGPDSAADPKPDRAIEFTIHGWDPSRWNESEKAVKTIVSFQLTTSWRAAWL